MNQRLHTAGKVASGRLVDRSARDPSRTDARHDRPGKARLRELDRLLVIAQSAPHGLGDKQRDEGEARDGQGRKEGSATAVDHYARMCRVVATCHVHVLTIAASS